MAGGRGFPSLLATLLAKMYVYSNWKFECNMWCGAAAVAVALMMDGAWKRTDPDPRPNTYANKRGLEGTKLTKYSQTGCGLETTVLRYFAMWNKQMGERGLF